MKKLFTKIPKSTYYADRYKLIYFIGGFLLELFSVLYITKLISITLSKIGFGEYSLFLSLFALVSILPFFSFHSAIERLLVKEEEKKFIIKLVIILSLFFFLVYGIVIFIYSEIDDKITIERILLFYFFCVTKILKTTLITIINIIKYNKEAFYFKLIDNLCNILFIFFLYWRNNITLEYIFYSSILSSIVAIVFSLVFLHKKYSLTSFNELNCVKSYNFVKKEILLFSLPFILWGSFIWLQNMVGRWYLNVFIDKESVANFSVVTSLAYLPVHAFTSVFGGFYVPRMYSKEKISPGYISHITKKIVIFSAALWVFVILFSYLLSDFIILFFLDAKYLEISYSLSILLIGNAMYCIGQLTIYEIYYYSKPEMLLVSNILPGVFSLVLGFFLIKTNGFNGAIISNVVAFGFSGIVTYYISIKFSKRRVYAD